MVLKATSFHIKIPKRLQKSSNKMSCMLPDLYLKRSLRKCINPLTHRFTLSGIDRHEIHDEYQIS